ncbi:MAG: hypothetical protein UV71_C0015G0031 [Microgenomates group bacterium GW2011_GWC1_43_13]|nr:MAG: hypothetical protein UV71_C0015G0031 [Microgenomates group bacterium GW2011_GWC1_43_13]
MKNLNILSKIALFIFVVLTIQFIYFGITTSLQGIYEKDSIIFHIPIAQEISKLIFLPANLSLGLGYLPATAESILSLFILLHLPLNLFNVLAFVLLFIVSKKVSESFGVTKEMSIIYAVSVVTLQSVLRWPLTQSADIWVAVFFLATLYFLVNPKPTNKHYLLLGFSSGMLVGAKFSGLPFLAILLIFFGRNAFKKTNIIKVLLFLIPLLVFGFSWYIRNYILTGNPVYPVGIFSIPGSPDYANLSSSNWSIVANVINNPAFIIKVVNALLSEFFIWVLVLMLPVYLLIKKNRDKVLEKLSIIGFLIFVIFIFTFPAESVVSNMRHIYPLMAILILQAFIFFEKRKLQMAAFSLLATIFPLMNLDYHPKILILAFIPAFYFIFK